MKLTQWSALLEDITAQDHTRVEDRCKIAVPAILSLRFSPAISKNQFKSK
jgi:hypothetical protein